jgi:putative membrane protein
MSWESFLPLFNTSLIVISGIALLIGFFFIKRKNIPAHKRCMITATIFAGLFLVVYVTRWAVLPPKFFQGEGTIRTLYFVNLIVHMILAIGIVPLVIITLRRALRGEYAKHKKIARITLPIWLYVAVSGWVVYWMLYHL